VIPTGLNNVIGIGCGFSHSLALKYDGSIIAWRSNYHGQCTIPIGLEDVIGISCGLINSIALKSDGTVVAWGYNGNDEYAVPEGLVVHIDYDQSYVLK